MSVSVDCRPQTTRLHPALSLAVASVFLQLCLKSSFSSPNLFSKCSCLALFLCSLVVSTVVLAWQHCHQISWVCVQAISTFFFIAAPAPVRHLFIFHSSSLDILSGQCTLMIFRRHLLTKTCLYSPVLIPRVYQTANCPSSVSSLTCCLQWSFQIPACDCVQPGCYRSSAARLLMTKLHVYTNSVCLPKFTSVD